MALEQLHRLPEYLQQIILDGPALAPPPGTISNLADPPNQNALGIAITTICLVISTVTVALAAHAKFHGGKKVRCEDLIVLAGYVITRPSSPTYYEQEGLTVGVAYCTYDGGSSIGYFVHQWNVRVTALAHVFYMVHVGAIVYSVGIVLLKIAILLQWIHIFVPRGTRGSFYWISHGVIAFNVLLYATVILTICASCEPFAKLWDPTIPGKCIASREAIDISTATTNLSSDIVILILPQSVIWKLRLETRKKVEIAVVFFVGIFAIVSAALRLYSSVRFFRTEDKTYNVIPVALWGMAELTCGILIYCIPTIPSVLRNSRLYLSLKPVTAAVSSWAKSSVTWISSSSSRNSGSGSRTTRSGFKTPQPVSFRWPPVYDDYGGSEVASRRSDVEKGRENEELEKEKETEKEEEEEKEAPPSPHGKEQTHSWLSLDDKPRNR
ncbi:hypothetical protein F4808DRAFT_462722 [Astrocystis sublimbata]|nr:hypothetical protein F4808DRAFT_462722 [Astrocystis sublimbata]